MKAFLSFFFYQVVGALIALTLVFRKRELIAYTFWAFRLPSVRHEDIPQMPPLLRRCAETAIGDYNPRGWTVEMMEATRYIAAVWGRSFLWPWWNIATLLIFPGSFLMCLVALLRLRGFDDGES